MAQIGLDDVESARKSLAEAEKLIPLDLQSGDTQPESYRQSLYTESVHHDWLIPEILRREAAALIRQAATETGEAERSKQIEAKTSLSIWRDETREIAFGEDPMPESRRRPDCGAQWQS